MNDEDKFSFVPGGWPWPSWEQQAVQILDGIRARILTETKAAEEAAEETEKEGKLHASYIAFNDFLLILDAFLSQLIGWAEQRDLPKLRDAAGWALADRLQFLSTQQRDWCNENEGFKKSRARFGDRRHARSPRSYLGWLAGDYLRELIHERQLAGLLLSPSGCSEKSVSYAQLLGHPEERISWLEKLKAMPDFSCASAREWADVVFEIMERDEQRILDSPQIRNCKSRDSIERRRSGKPRLYDYKRTIVGAITRQASKPVGSVRGITRPA